MFFKRFIILFFCFAFALSSIAQDNSKAIALITILQTIEKQHRVTFNYIDTEILIFNIQPPKIGLTLNEKLNYLHEQTQLLFENIDNKFIIVSNYKYETNSICGYIYDKDNAIPLENANIEFENKKGTKTNKKGFFEIKNTSSKSFVISHVGYISKKIAISDLISKNCPKIFMESEVLELEVVQANRILTSGISKKIDGVFEIKPKKFGLLPGLIEPDVLQTMQQIPGINSADESVSSINVRGGTHDQNLFLWNGIRMYQTGHFFGLISVFNPNLAHTISISKNGSSAFFGESVSSVVAISSNQNNNDKNSFGAGINMINADIYAKLKVNKKGFVEVSGRRSINDLVELPTYKEYFNRAFQNTTITNFSNNQIVDYNHNEKFNFYDVSVKYDQKIGAKDRFIFDLITINDQLKVDHSAITSNATLVGSNIIYQKNYGGNFSWSHQWNSKNSSQISSYSSSYELDAEDANSQSNQNSKQENLVLDNGIKLENHHKLNSKFTFSNGYQFNEIGVSTLDEINSPQFYKLKKDVLQTHAVILELKCNDTISKINFNIGLRSNYTTQFNKYLLEPRLQFNYGISKSLNFGILGEFKSQNCVQIIDLQKDYFGVEKRRWQLADDASIPVQKSKQIAVNLTYSKKDWLFSFENFYKTVDGINSSSQGFQNQLEFVKTNGSYTVSGAEMLLQKRINHFVTWLSYSYNNNKYNFPTIVQNTFSNNFEIIHVVSWAGIYEYKKLKIALGSKWYSGRPETTPSSNLVNTSNPSNPTIDYNMPNSKNLENFFQVNLSTTYSWTTEKGLVFKLGVSVLNLLNRQNEISEYYRINAANNSIEDVKTYSLQRTPNVSLRVSF
jgi:hypothetical protein